MNTKEFKTMLFSCVIGVAGCNKIGNPSYMDGSGDRKEESKEKRRKIDDSYGDSKAGTSSAVAASQGSTIDYNKVLGNTLSSMKRLADATEQVAIRDQESVERAIRAAADSKVVAEAARKAADDAEKNTPGSGGGDAVYNKAFHNTLSSMKRLADATEQVAIRDQESVERAIKAAADSKVVAEAARKAADDAEKNTPGSGGGGDASTSTGMTCKAEDDKEKEFKLKFGEGGDTL